MKRALVISAVLATVAAAAWSGVWLWARASLEAEIDTRLAALAESRELEISYQSRSVGGFPFVLEARLVGITATRPDWGAMLAIPEMQSRASVFAPAEFETRLPPEMRLEFSGGAAEAGGEPWRLAIDILSEDLVVTSRPGADGARETALTAASIVVVPAEPDPARAMGIEFAEVALTSGAPASGPVSTEARIGQIALLATVPALGGTRAVTLDWLMEGVALSAQGRLRDEVDAEMLINGIGRLAIGFDAGRSDLVIDVAGVSAEESGRLAVVQSRVQGGLTIENGVLTLTGASREIALTLSPAAPEGKIGGTVSIPAAEGRLSLPVAPSEAMSDFALTLALDGIIGNEALWASLDPEGRMLRDPGLVDLDVEGTVRVTRSFTVLRPGEAPPFEFGNVSVNGAQLRLLGAAADLVGDIEFLQPINLAQGVLTLTMAQVLEAADQLVAVGLIAAPHRDYVLAMASQYARPGGREGELVSEIEFGPIGITANGVPVGVNY